MTCSGYILIGDVHGCLTEWQALIGRIVPRTDDTLVFLDDLVDKGTDSADPREIVTYPRQQRDLYGKMQRIRFISPEGKVLQLGHETARDHYWAARYDGRLGTVYFGHQVFLQPTPSVVE